MAQGLAIDCERGDTVARHYLLVIRDGDTLTVLRRPVRQARCANLHFQRVPGLSLFLMEQINLTRAGWDVLLRWQFCRVTLQCFATYIAWSIVKQAAVTCIFCSAESGRPSVAHIVPESLGGNGAPIGRPGATCDACNQYFGQKVESKALQSFPFIGFRVLHGVPSKKGAMPSMATTVGTVHATGRSGFIALEPRNQNIAGLVAAGEISQLRVIAEVNEPLAVCRMLLKIGLEQLGKHFYEVAVSERVQAAREFARRPKRGEQWWFIIRGRPDEYCLRSEAPPEFSVEIVERGGVLISAMHMTGISTMVPLEPRASPPEVGELPEPEFRTVLAVC